MEDLYFTESLVQQNLSKLYAEVTPMVAILYIAVHILDSSRSSDQLGSGRRELMSILRTRLYILTNTRRRFWSIWKMNTAPNQDICPSLDLKLHWVTISSIPQWHEDLVNLLKIHMICPVMMKNTQCLELWLKQHLDEVISKNVEWQPQASDYYHCLKLYRTGARPSQFSMLDSLTQWILAVHFAYPIVRTGGN